MNTIEQVPHLWIPLPDGTRLAARLWRPAVPGGRAVPALVEYLPYRKGDGTAAIDPVRHAWFAARGFACLRIDLRGSGDSDGLLHDEYLEQELQDGVDALAWVAAQPWCDGRVGLFGISWGGFNALQIAARRPPALVGVVSACATDDRYADDVHYVGGCVLASDMPGWASQLTAMQARAPDPGVRPDDWRTVWLERLDALPHLAATWLAHPLRDRYWRHGSVGEDIAAIGCPVFLAGGWADGYRNGIARLSAGLAGRARALIGPWAHAWPNAARPGPSIGFQSECLAWWQAVLASGGSPTVGERAALLAWEQDPVAPEQAHRQRPGRWVGLASWPSAMAGWRLVPEGLEPCPSGRDPSVALARSASAPLGRIGTDLQHGAQAGAWCPSGGSGDLPGDQREDNARALCFAMPDGIHGPMHVLGRPRVRLRLAADRPQAQLVVRLCDIAPGGAALLVARGVLDLTHHDHHSRCVPRVPGRPFDVDLRLDACGHRLPPGHRWLLAIAPSYWPMVWPAPEPVTLTIHAGELWLPVHDGAAGAGGFEPGPPDGDPPLALAAVRPARSARSRTCTEGILTISHGVDGGAWRWPEGWVTDQRSEDTRVIALGDPCSAEVRCVREYGRYDRHGERRVRVTARMTCTADEFVLEQRLEAHADGACVRQREWTARLPRVPPAVLAGTG